VGFSLKRIVKKGARLVKRIAPAVAGFVPGGTVALKAASALKSAGINYNRLTLAEKGKLVSALPVSENVAVTKATLAPTKRISVTGTAAAFSRAPKKKSQFQVDTEQKRKDAAYLNSLLSRYSADEVAQLRAEWTRKPQGYTWPEYIAVKLG
jgi:hypothetical protein